MPARKGSNIAKEKCHLIKEVALPWLQALEHFKYGLGHAGKRKIIYRKPCIKTDCHACGGDCVERGYGRHVYDGQTLIGDKYRACPTCIMKMNRMRSDPHSVRGEAAEILMLGNFLRLLGQIKK